MQEKGGKKSIELLRLLDEKVRGDDRKSSIMVLTEAPKVLS